MVRVVPGEVFMLTWYGCLYPWAHPVLWAILTHHLYHAHGLPIPCSWLIIAHYDPYPSLPLLRSTILSYTIPVQEGPQSMSSSWLIIRVGHNDEGVGKKQARSPHGGRTLSHLCLPLHLRLFR